MYNIHPSICKYPIVTIPAYTQTETICNLLAVFSHSLLFSIVGCNPIKFVKETNVQKDKNLNINSISLKITVGNKVYS